MTTSNDGAGHPPVTYLNNHNEKLESPPGPLKGLWSLWYMDRKKALNIMLGHVGIGKEGPVKKLYDNFTGILPPGTDFPETSLENTKGERVNLRDFVGKKHVVIMTGAIT